MAEVYKIQAISNQESTLHAQLNINVNHPVFEGHFPQRAVLPGVIQIGMIKSVLSEYFAKQYRLRSAKNVKYLSMVLPDKNQNLDLEIKYTENEDNQLKVKAVLKAEEQVFLKFSGEFVEDND